MVRGPRSDFEQWYGLISERCDHESLDRLGYQLFCVFTIFIGFVTLEKFRLATNCPCVHNITVSVQCCTNDQRFCFFQVVNSFIGADLFAYMEFCSTISFLGHNCIIKIRAESIWQVRHHKTLKCVPALRASTEPLAVPLN